MVLLFLVRCIMCYLTSVSSIDRSISSSQTLDQNSIPCKHTSSLLDLIAVMVICISIEKKHQ